MPVYHQMGNDSINLVFEEGLSTYRGAILSPVNCDKEGTAKFISRMRALANFEVIFDPQLYFPKSEMGCLPAWDYFPKGVRTADPSSSKWWQAIVDSLVASMSPLQPDAVCSPAMVPRTFPDSFFEELVRVSDYLTEQLGEISASSILTLIVDLTDISQKGRALTIASIISRAKCDRVYVVFKGDTEPRRELNNPEEIKGAMTLIQVLEESGMSVLVSFCSSDVILWKSVGASACATGKFFNLRRFTLKRFAEPSSGGGQIPYWFEEALLGFIRQSDLIRVQQKNLASAASAENPFGAEIIRKFSANEPWLALSWKQFMWWFCNVEERLSSGVATARQLVEDADAAWATLERAPRVFFEERLNDGSWIRQWLRALEEQPNWTEP